jgi:hypothetical protein
MRRFGGLFGPFENSQLLVVTENGDPFLRVVAFFAANLAPIDCSDHSSTSSSTIEFAAASLRTHGRIEISMCPFKTASFSAACKQSHPVTALRAI